MKFTQSPAVGSGSSKFIKFKDGDTVKVILRGEPFEFRQIFKDGKSQIVDEGTEGSSFRFKINAAVNEDGKYVMKILEQGARVYNDLKALSEDYDLSKTVLKITRSGNGTSTVYNVIPLPGVPDSRAMNEVLQLKLNELSNKKSEPTFEDIDHDELPF